MVVITKEGSLQGLARDLLRDKHPVLVIHGKCTPIKEPVMEGAKGEAIGLMVWPSSLFPADVGCIKPHRY